MIEQFTLSAMVYGSITPLSCPEPAHREALSLGIRPAARTPKAQISTRLRKAEGGRVNCCPCVLPASGNAPFSERADLISGMMGFVDICSFSQYTIQLSLARLSLAHMHTHSCTLTRTHAFSLLHSYSHSHTSTRTCIQHVRSFLGSTCLVRSTTGARAQPASLQFPPPTCRGGRNEWGNVIAASNDEGGVGVDLAVGVKWYRWRTWRGRTPFSGNLECIDCRPALWFTSDLTKPCFL